MFENLFDPIVLVAALTLVGVLTGHLVKAHADKRTASQTARIDDQKIELEQQKATIEGLNSVVASLQEALAALRETVGAQQERIRFLAAQQADTLTQLGAEQESRQRQAEIITALTVDRDGLIDYAKLLRQHIIDKNPPPPPPWPNNYKKQSQAPSGA